MDLWIAGSQELKGAYNRSMTDAGKVHAKISWNSKKVFESVEGFLYILAQEFTG
ncbi:MULTISPECIES: hypothetical protein [Paenibacillus]|uniref:Uncharacterized protein n=1 Tax=Paenibacillus residui TaxID=629724 RepID=A0ABW3DB50_9BACL|nr:hypothetical protein [Aneurinibacillus sp. XH2]